MGLVRQVVETFRIPIIEAPGYEADDIIATLATQARDQGDDVLIVTGDRDAYQLVEDPLIQVLYNRRGVSDYALYDEAGIEERTGVTPTLYTQYAALRGDPSDNLAGVPGVGEKTAAKLINTYGGIDGIFEHVDEQTPKLRDEPRPSTRQQVRQNADVMVLLRDVPLEIAPDGLRARAVRSRRGRASSSTSSSSARCTSGSREVFGDDGRRWQPSGGRRARGRRRDRSTGRRRPRSSTDSPTSSSTRRSPSSRLGRRRRTQCRSLGLAVVARRSNADTRLGARGGARRRVRCARRCAHSWATAGRAVVAHGVKPLMRALLGQLDVDLARLCLDTMLAAYLLDPAESRYLIAELLASLHGARASVGEARRARTSCSSTSTATPGSTTRSGAPAIAVATLGRADHGGARRTAACARCTTTIENPARARAGQDGRRRASASTSTSCSTSTTVVRECASLDAARSGTTPARSST